ncbi:MAG: hypothetical protein ACNA8H_16100 [Anaerolineales bacterium]
MPSQKYDLAYLKAVVAQLERYLHSKELYFPTGEKPPPGEPPFPRITPGGLLLTVARLNAWQLTPTVASEYSSYVDQMEELIKNWRVAWEGKVVRDFSARLNLWKNFLEDHRKNPAANYDRYAYEVRSRVILHLLSKEGAQIPPEKLDIIPDLDRILKTVFVSGSFIWEQELSHGFPQGTYWYLYGSITEV